ncbi:hypothetical protein LDENG_00244930 [Lucifuga dentata]|nr:hypothetical protein LDENG_00244930 [Lucifuga dentata]
MFAPLKEVLWDFWKKSCISISFWTSEENFGTSLLSHYLVIYHLLVNKEKEYLYIQYIYRYIYVQSLIYLHFEFWHILLCCKIISRHTKGI